MKPKRDLSGNYLITHKNFVFSNSPEIFLLLQDGDEIIGICVNQPIRVSDAENNVTDLTYGKLASINSDFDHDMFRNYMDISVMNGGPDDRQFFVLHTHESGETKSHKYFRNFYCSAKFQDYRNDESVFSIPAYYSLHFGYKKFGPLELSKLFIKDGWEIRFGLHFMAYGFNLDRKYFHVDQLKKMTDTLTKTDGLDVGSLMNQLLDFSQEVIPSVMCAGMYNFLKRTSNLSDSDISDVSRAIIAVTEHEGGQIGEVMKKYTHKEFMEKFSSFRESGLDFLSLDRYDSRLEALKDLGLNHIYYDQHVARSLMKSKHGEANKTGTTGRARMLEKTLGSLARIKRDQ